MGFFKDIRQLKQSAEELQDQLQPDRPRGLSGQFKQMGSMVQDANDSLSALSRQQADAQRLMATGLIGQATVQALRDTGMTINENPQVEFDLLVSVDGRDPYPVTHRQVVSRLVISNFQPGASIPVRVDPADPTRVLIG
ncbi:DUF3592 domain-containing protein [Conexibacter stalactiti]|uniref:DUF3592 domain-containing protein n=1 Tax=Conexibacter stalactiti TaxID=1940611 RepID=A0ABU4HRG5_9ACTN|nr:DUF3592 domain-containing protein [Conexibacter stalactiti]MDW5595297.1 DUF3592 domain-containing protein [Conexibacter stalactiti]MEC5035939.1 DUF3592 domain-containing protein [Conexibacter stalactiti]